MRMKWYDWFSYTLLVIGGVNWGAYGISRLFNQKFDLITSWAPSWLANSIFVIVGIAGLYGIITAVKIALK